MLNSSDDLSLHLPASADNQNPENNPFNNWLNFINNNNNNAVNQSNPRLPNRVQLPKPAISAGDLAKFIG
jgi:hypothetical protein